MDELLFHYSIDTYKALTMNTKLLLEEYLKTVDSIKEGLLKDKNQIPIFEEIVWTLEDDKIAQKIIGKQKCAEFFKNNGSYDEYTKKKICQLFWHKLSGTEYLKEIEKQLRYAIENNLKKEINNYSKKFVRELTVLGYDSRYVFSCLNKVFYSKKVENIRSVDKFFAYFNNKIKIYTVYLTVHKELAQFSSLLSEKIPENMIVVLSDSNIPEDVQKVAKYEIIEIKNIEAFDEYSAYNTARKIIGLLRHFYSFFRYMENDIGKNGYVKEMEGKIKFIKDPISGIEKVRKNKSFEKSSVGALDLFDKATMNYENLYKLSRVMEIHNMALDLKSPANTLLSLWSILELLLEKEENDNDRSRISNIIELVMPYIKNSYIEKLIMNLLADLKRWNNKKTETILSKIEVGESDLEKLFVFVTFKEYDNDRKQLYEKLDTFPLLRFRIFSLNEKMKDKKSIDKLLSEHEKRVKWHLQRIYRARNCIIHDGDEITNIESLVENLLSYIDIICERIIQKLGKSGFNYTVSDAIIEENLQDKEYITLLENTKDINRENYLVFLYHGSK